jgi:hypothetical protein
MKYKLLIAAVALIAVPLVVPFASAAPKARSEHRRRFRWLIDEARALQRVYVLFW